MPVLATLLDFLLNSIAKLDMKLDLSTVRAQMVGLGMPGTGLGTATHFLNYEMALDTLQEDELVDLSKRACCNGAWDF